MISTPDLPEIARLLGSNLPETYPTRRTVATRSNVGQVVGVGPV